MCIDAPESTTNSRSSGLRFDGAGRHLFSEGEKNAVLCFSFKLMIFLASLHAASRAHRALAFRLFLRPILKILKQWCYADEDHLGKSFQAMDLSLEC